MNQIKKSLQTPILFIVFNRPDVTKRVLHSIKSTNPTKLYIAADGPRPDRVGEDKKCETVREIVKSFDLKCDVQYKFNEKNKGCKRTVSNAIDWIFENEESAIILEDDTLPDNSFFEFCEELLDKYQDDNRVMTISGDNFQFGRIRNEYSYYFSRYIHCWGWATWRRAWKHYDSDMSLWPEIRKNKILNQILNDNKDVKYWTNIFDRCFAGEIDSWAYRWTFSCWCQSGLTILPNINLVSNIGFGEEATHTSVKNHLSCIKTEKIKLPLHHPEYVIRDSQADTFTQKYSIDPPPICKRVINKLYRILIH